MSWTSCHRTSTGPGRDPIGISTGGIFHLSGESLIQLVEIARRDQCVSRHGRHTIVNSAAEASDSSDGPPLE